MYKSIRNIALGIIIQRDHVLMQMVCDSPKATYRPIGGQINFGETAEQAVIREYREELNWTVSVIIHVGWLENIFSHDNQLGHEFVSVFLLNSPDLPFDLKEFTFIENDPSASEMQAMWVSLRQIAMEDVTIVPNGLVELMQWKTKKSY